MNKNMLKMFISFVLGLVIGLILFNSSVPKNCAELGLLYLEIGKNQLEISDFGSQEWQNLIGAETKMVNDCYNTMTK